ncbi:PAS domain-containing protein [Anianabacter salinae]|uniref:PAS domain-containing protein n=1 Tax=Anianabacter salinae TaxID=2851023 RepID=UPI00225E16C2|nr:PAS domain-containing protein [Anianabacter salinae]MBV0912153.1 PAS domain-containing protein [Anianabacter salinae]
MTQTSDQTAQVIRLMDHALPRRYPAIAIVDAYWEALRGTRAMPERHEIDPRGLDRALPNAFILDRVAPGVARFRLAGMHLADVMGMDVRGMPITALMCPEARMAIADLIEEAVCRPAVATLALTGETGFGRPALVGRMLLAPMSSEDGAGSRLLGAVEMHGEIGRTPRRFSVSEVALRQIEAPGWAGPALRTRTPAAPMAAHGMAEAQAAYTETPRVTGERPKLRLIKSV